MNDNKSALDIVSSASNTIIGDEFSFRSLYLKLNNEYSDYTINDLLTVCKIDLLWSQKCISNETHDYLIELFNQKIELETRLHYLDDENKIKNLYKEIHNINQLLTIYGVYPISIVSLLSDNINRHYYDSIDEMVLKQSDLS